MKNFLVTKNYLIGYLVIIVGILSLGFFSHVYAQSTATLQGFAWSSNIGWIKMSGPTYGVSVAGTTGVQSLSGFAWSNNIGWINFGPNNCGSTPTINYDDGLVTGWAHALAGGTNGSGGWDGCIHLVGADYGVTYTEASPTVGELSGYAWGSNVVGWVKFKGDGYGVTLSLTPLCQDPTATNFGDPVPCTYSGQPTLTLTASPAVVTAVGQTTTLFWDSADTFVSCVATGGDSDWNGTNPAVPPGSQTGVLVPTDPTTYTITCTDANGQTASDSATVVVLEPDALAVTLTGGTCVEEPGQLIGIQWTSNVQTGGCFILEGTVPLHNNPLGPAGAALIEIDQTTTFSVLCTDGAQSVTSAPHMVTVTPDCVYDPPQGGAGIPTFVEN